MKLSIYGCGYVGLVTAACFAKLGHDVLAVDIDDAKVAALQQGQSPIHERDLESLLRLNNLSFTTDLKHAIDFAAVQFICVGTPETASGAADLSAVYACAQIIAEHMQSDKIIVVKSTVPVGTGDELTQQMHTTLAQRDVEWLAHCVSNPEFLREGLAVSDFLQPDRVIIGTDHDEAFDTIASLYASITSAQHPTLRMSRRSSELCKYASNAMLATRISFVNELSRLAEQVDADIEAVTHGMGWDARIGPQFLRAGCGYGGSCFPKDVAALRYTAQQHDCSSTLLDAVHQVNQQQKHLLIDKVIKHYGDNLQGKTFALWGLAFKPDTDDIREASSLTIIPGLLQRGATLQAYDPAAMENVKQHFAAQDNLYFCDTQQQCLQNADALLIITEWDCFKSANLDDIATHIKVIIDGRNLYSPAAVKQAGITYDAIGRPTS